jgi:hypothetical protein
MNRRVKLVYAVSIVIASIPVISFISCNNNPDKTATVAEKPLAEQKLEGAISCTKMGIPVVDSALYMEGGVRNLLVQ